MSVWDTVMSDTVGTVYRATTGKVDPWTTNEINQNAAQDISNASIPVGGTQPTISVDDALAQIQQQTAAVEANQPKNICGVTSADFNAWQCLTQSIPAWALWVGGGILVLILLGDLAPWARLAEGD